MVVMFGIGENQNNKLVRENAVSVMSDFLMGLGFTPVEADNASRKFWTDNAKKLNQVLAR
jgi:hypothetical protein